MGPQIEQLPITSVCETEKRRREVVKIINEKCELKTEVEIKNYYPLKSISFDGHILINYFCKTVCLNHYCHHNFN